jgi:DNA polymerase-3 subunit epsilon
LVKVVNGRIVDTLHSLIKPPNNCCEFNYYNSKVHGITSLDVCDAPSWEDFYNEFMDFTQSDTLIAHNVAFDKSCLEQMNAIIKIDNTYEWLCTLINARRLLPNLSNHRLPTVAGALAVPLKHHHEALADARAAAQIALELAKLGELR